ncbi:MAG: type II secretion system secretin GspD [Bryobacterales bacterium]|nr:type II secretion system secretin GspD [Bryobacterales bacterium]
MRTDIKHFFAIGALAASLLPAAMGWAQNAPASAQAPATATPQTPAPQTPAEPATAPAQPAAAPSPAPVQASQSLVLDFNGADLRTVIDLLARQLRINYILDPRVDGAVTIKTYGEIRAVEVRSILETILRINGASMVQVGDIFRIVPATDAVNLPLSPMVNASTAQLPGGEEAVLNLLFLKYATVKEMEGVVRPFLGQGAQVTSFAPANLLMILDNARNMRRTMELVSLFDSDAFATQRVRLFEVKNGKPSDIAAELEKIMKGIAFSSEGGSTTFIPIDRINLILAVAPNPGVFDEVEKWLAKLDVSVAVSSGSINNYVYRVKYSDAFMLSQSIMQLYTGMPVGMGMYGGGYGGFGGGMGGYGGMGGGYGGFGGMGGMGGYGGMGGGFGGFGMGGFTNRGFNLGAQGMAGAAGMGGAAGVTGAAGAAGASGVAAGQNPTANALYGGMGAYGNMAGGLLGMGYGPMLSPTGERIPHVIPNFIDNSLLIQATPQEYEQLLKLLEQIDIAPRQVLIEAKVFEVSLTGAFAAGVNAYLNRLGDGQLDPGSGDSDGGRAASVARRALAAASTGGGLTMTAGMLVGHSRELLAVLTAAQDNRLTKVIASPSILATDSIPASITVGTEVPVLTSQAASAVQQGGTSQFAQTITSRQSGTNLKITARVTPAGIVTLLINQSFSTPQAAASSGIQSPSFNNRSIDTQITIRDGDTIAFGGIIQENNLEASAGIPYLHRIPVLGAAFGSKSQTKTRTELVVFLTPRVIYDTNQMLDASDELMRKMDRVKRLMNSSEGSF